VSLWLKKEKKEAGMETDEAIEVIEVKSTKTDPEKKKWHEFRIQEEQETPKRLEDAAKFLSSMISISLTIFLSVIGKGGLASIGKREWIITVIFLWVASLVASFFVIFLFKYKFSKDSIATFIDAHKKIVKRKRILLIISTACYILALGLLGVLVLGA
jgi:glucan phosphoethanolaminetransferase (alkaline phosphatase superfamily)